MTTLATNKIYLSLKHKRSLPTRSLPTFRLRIKSQLKRMTHQTITSRWITILSWPWTPTRSRKIASSPFVEPSNLLLSIANCPGASRNRGLSGWERHTKSRTRPCWWTPQSLCRQAFSPMRPLLSLRSTLLRKPNELYYPSMSSRTKLALNKRLAKSRKNRSVSHLTSMEWTLQKHSPRHWVSI